MKNLPPSFFHSFNSSPLLGGTLPGTACVFSLLIFLFHKNKTKQNRKIGNNVLFKQLLIGSYICHWG